MNYVICTNNDGFEDVLTNHADDKNKVYDVRHHRGASIKIVDDSGNLRWYGLSKFEVVG